MADQMDLQREQAKMLAGEVAFCTSSLKRLTEQLANNPDDVQLQVSFLVLGQIPSIYQMVKFTLCVLISPH
jgi:hypothetical protein